MTFPVLFDRQNQVSKLYDVTAMPSTVIVDRKGQVRFVHYGYTPGTESEYQDQIRTPDPGEVMNTRRIRRLLPLLVGVAVMSGCGIQPWVKPYERDRLADPIMSFDRNPVSAAYTQPRPRVPRSGPRRIGQRGGGCGCNWSDQA